jgi:hypothetical protein
MTGSRNTASQAKRYFSFCTKYDGKYSTRRKTTFESKTNIGREPPSSEDKRKIDKVMLLITSK